MIDTTTGLTDHIEQAIQKTAYLNGRKLCYETSSSGEVTLTGTVNTYFQKQMAQEVVRRVDGVQSIRNHLQVSKIAVADTAVTN